MSASPELSKIVDLEDLPSPPSVAAKLLEIFSDPSVKVLDLVKTLSVDPILSARIIAYANSPAISVRREVVHLKQAVVVLGMRMVKTIALSFSIIESCKNSPHASFDLDGFWKKSLICAVAAKHVCGFSSQDAELGFLSGLMMEIGELAVAFSSKTREQIVEEHPEFRVKRPIDLKTNGHLDQYQLTGLILQQWNFPRDLIFVVANLCGEESLSDLQKALVLSSGICEIISNDHYEMSQIQSVKNFAQEHFKISDEIFQGIFESIGEEWREYATLLQFDSSHKSLAEIERDSKKQITSMNLSLQRENSAICQENDHLREQINMDELTGLENRRGWEERIAIEWNRAYRNGTPFTIMMVDIDHFKIFNDTHGHAVGDQVLAHVAKMLQNNLRMYDEAFRIGGEEFILLLPQCEFPMAIDVAERVLESVSESRVKVDTQDLCVTVSIGVAQWDPSRKQTVDELFNEADTQLFRAKRSGRNKVCFDPRFEDKHSQP